MSLSVKEYRQTLEERVAGAPNETAKAEAEVERVLWQLRTGEGVAATAALSKMSTAGASMAQPDRARVTAVAMYGAAVASYQLGHYAEAVSELLNTIEAARIAHMPQIHARALAFVAVACARLGAHRDGLAYGLEALEAGVLTGDLRTMVTARLAMATLHNERDQPERALRYLEDVVEPAERLGDPLTLCALKAARAATAVTQVQTIRDQLRNDTVTQTALRIALQRAHRLSDESLAHARNAGHRPAEISALGNCAEVAFIAGDVDGAIAIISSAFDLAKGIGSVDNMASAKLTWGSYLFSLEQIEQALSQLLQGLDYARESGLVDVEKNIQQKLSQCYERLGRPLDALAALKGYARTLELQRNAELADLAALTELKRELLSVRGGESLPGDGEGHPD